MSSPESQGAPQRHYMPPWIFLKKNLNFLKKKKKKSLGKGEVQLFWASWSEHWGRVTLLTSTLALLAPFIHIRPAGQPGAQRRLLSWPYTGPTVALVFGGQRHKVGLAESLPYCLGLPHICPTRVRHSVETGAQRGSAAGDTNPGVSPDRQQWPGSVTPGSVCPGLRLPHL